MKKIAIDCRYLGMSGIGRFLEGILENLDLNKNQYTLIGKKEKIEKYKNCKYLINDSSPFSIKGIINFNKEINDYDIFFTPNFIIPYGVKIKCITVLHDIIFLDMPKVNGSFLEKMLKKHLLKRCVRMSQTVFTVSKFSKNRICHYFKNVESKVIYSYQGVAKQFKEYNEIHEKENYMVYVGNIKKHKGLNILLRAYELLQGKIELYIVGDSSGFKNGDKESLKIMDELNVKFTGKVKDKELLDIISRAKFLIQPSLYEGFGLPPMEALYLGTKPIISDIPVFKEVYGELPVDFFKSGDYTDLAKVILNADSIVKINKDELNEKFSYSNYANIIELKFKEI